MISSINRKLIPGILVLVLAVSCQNTVQIDFIVENQTGDKISVVREFTDSSLAADSNHIVNLTKLRILDYVNYDYNDTKSHMDGLRTMPWVDSLRIIDSQGNIYIGNPVTLEGWVKLYPDTKYGRGAFILAVTADDFQ